MRNEVPFNPLDLTNLGLSIIQALVERPIELLPPQEAFTGAGIYAIYYIGGLEYYRVLSTQDASGNYVTPIYIGKAIPKGARRTGFGSEASMGTELYQRLREHANTIKRVENLELADFRCRYLVVEPLWISVAESLLIRRYTPLWNIKVDGFGNHDPGSGRPDQKRPLWDTLHPGRRWAARRPPNNRTPEQIVEDIASFLAAPKEEKEKLAVEKLAEDEEEPS